MRPRGRGEHIIEIADRVLERLMQRCLREHAIGARRDGARLLARPGGTRAHEAQTRKPEIRHRARDRPDVLGELRLDQDHGRSRPLDPIARLVGPGAGHVVSLRLAALREFTRH